MGDNKNERDAAPGNKRERAKQARSRRKSTTGQIDWSVFDWETHAALVVALGQKGGAVRLGTTRDGGAFALGIYCGEDYATEYIRPAEDVTEALLEIADAWLDDWRLEMAHARTVLGVPDRKAPKTS